MNPEVTLNITSRQTSLSFVWTEVATVNSRGTADVGSDYVITSELIEFSSSETSKTFTVSILDDDKEELDETFTVAIVSTSSGFVGDPSEAIVTITDDDEDSETGWFVWSI